MSVLIAAALVYVVLAFGLYLFQARLIYFPERRIEATPHDIGLPFDAASFRARDGIALSGWFIPDDHPIAVMLCCNGNAGNISHRLQLVEFLHRLHISVFLFDYRGYGESEGTPGEKGTYLDAAAAWDYLTDKYKVDPRRIVIHGQSLGGPIASWLAREKDPAALVVESTFTSLPDLAAGMYPFFPVRMLTRFQYSTGKYLQELHCPVLIVHSPDDEIIPFRHGKDLYAMAKEPKEFLEIRGDHNGGFLVSGENYSKTLVDFMQKFVER